MTWQEKVGVVAGLINLSGIYWYVRGMFRPASGQERTRPQRVTWWLWAFIGMIISWESYEVGARATLWLAFSAMLGPLIIAILSIRYGQGGRTNTDLLCGALCLLCLFLRAMTVSAHWVLLLALAADTIAAWPTWEEYWRQPDRLARRTWMVGGAATGLNFLAIPRWDIWLIIQPLHIFLMHIFSLYLLFRTVPVERVERKTATL